MFSWQNTEHLNSPNSERVCHTEITNRGCSWLRGAVREGAVPNCSMSGSGKSSFGHSGFFLKVGLVQKVSKLNRLQLPGFVNTNITDWILSPRASPSPHSCAECAHRQRFCFFGKCGLCCWKEKGLHSSYSKSLQPYQGGNPEGAFCFQHT